MNTWSCVSEIAKPCGRRNSASQPTTVSRSSMLSTSLPSGWPGQSLMGVPSSLTLGVGDRLRRVAPVPSVHVTQNAHQALLLDALGDPGRQAAIHEIVEARQLPQPVLPAELVEPRHAPLAVSDQVERGHVDLPVGPPIRRHLEGLQEPRMVLQRQASDALAPERDGPAREAVHPHHARRPAADRVHRPASSAG